MFTSSFFFRWYIQPSSLNSRSFFFLFFFVFVIFWNGPLWGSIWESTAVITARWWSEARWRVGFGWSSWWERYWWVRLWKWGERLFFFFFMISICCWEKWGLERDKIWDVLLRKVKILVKNELRLHALIFDYMKQTVWTIPRFYFWMWRYSFF